MIRSLSQTAVDPKAVNPEAAVANVLEELISKVEMIGSSINNAAIDPKSVALSLEGRNLKPCNKTL